MSDRVGIAGQGAGTEFFVADGREGVGASGGVAKTCQEQQRLSFSERLNVVLHTSCQQLI